MLTPQQIYEQITTGPGTESLEIARDMLATCLPQENFRAALTSRIVHSFTQGWEGAAGTAAQDTTSPLRDSIHRGATLADLTKQLHDREIEVFHAVANRVVPVPEQPPGDNVLDDTMPWITDYDQRVADYQARARHNIETYRFYDETSREFENALPREYVLPDDVGGDITVTPPATVDGSGSPPGSPTTGADPATGSATTRQSQPTDDAPGVAAAAGATGADAQASPVDPAGQTVLDVTVAQGGQHTAPTAPGGSMTGTGTGAGTGTGTGTPGFAIGGAAASTTGRGESGTAGPGTGGLGARGEAPKGPGGPGAGSAKPVTEQATRRDTVGAGGAAARSGPAGGVPVGGGSGRDRDDTRDEHDRKYLAAADPEGTFGNEELTAPQVIGDPAYEDGEPT